MAPDLPDDDTSAEADSAFGVLSDVHRRYVLYYLRDRGSATVEELATVLAGWLGTRQDPSDVITAEDRERLRVSLHHTHLPTLADADLVRYDPEAGTVSAEPLPELVEELLDLSLEQQREAPGRPEERRFDWRTNR